MTTDIFETSKVTVTTMLTHGVPTEGKVSFIFTKDGTEFKREDGQINAGGGSGGSAGSPSGGGSSASGGDSASASSSSSTATSVTCTIDAPVVPDDKPSYLLEWSVEADGQTLKSASDYRVWPKTAEVTSVREGDKAALPGFVCKVMQNSSQVGSNYKTAGDPAVCEVRLNAGHPWDIEAVSPFEIKKKTPTKLRKLEVEAVRHFEAEFVEPLKPSDGKLKQWVNLDSASGQEGRDGKGYELVVKIGAKGDRDGTNDPKAGGAGVFAFVKVKFGGADGAARSKRNDPKPDLVAGLQLSARAVVTADEEFTGKVELSQSGGVGTFKVNLGCAGGDTCTISIGSTDACGDASIEITNWRKLFYELVYPDVMDADMNTLRPAATGDGGKDLPTSIKSLIDARLGKAFLVYEMSRSNKFTKSQAPAGAYLPAAYLGMSGSADRYVVTRVSGAEPIPFAAADNRRIDIHLCHRSFVNIDGIKNENRPILRSNYLAVQAPPGRVFLPKAASNGADALDLTGCKWTAKVAPGTMVDAAITYAASVRPNSVKASRRTIKIEELKTGKSVDLVYTQPTLAHIPTDLSADQQTQIEEFAADACAPAARVLEFRITADKGSTRQDTRHDNVKAALEQAVTDLGQTAYHPGLDDSNVPRSGAVNVAWLNFHSLPWIQVTLPDANATDPGKLAGPDSDTTCGIEVVFKVESAFEINGAASGASQIMVLKTHAAGSCASVFCHELGHSMGMTIMAGRSNAPPGMDAAKHVDNGGTYYLNGSPVGNGIRSSHVGPHCATNLSATQLAGASYNGLNGTCIMFGESGEADTQPGYCPTCVEYVKGRRLIDIRSSWASRSGAAN